MPVYHASVNGEINQCHAEVKSCPLGAESDHFMVSNPVEMETILETVADNMGGYSSRRDRISERIIKRQRVSASSILKGQLKYLSSLKQVGAEKVERMFAYLIDPKEFSSEFSLSSYINGDYPSHEMRYLDAVAKAVICHGREAHDTFTLDPDLGRLECFYTSTKETPQTVSFGDGVYETQPNGDTPTFFLKRKIGERKRDRDSHYRAFSAPEHPDKMTTEEKFKEAFVFHSPLSSPRSDPAAADSEYRKLTVAAISSGRIFRRGLYEGEILWADDGTKALRLVVAKNVTKDGSSDYDEYRPEAITPTVDSPYTDHRRKRMI